MLKYLIIILAIILTNTLTVLISNHANIREKEFIVKECNERIIETLDITIENKETVCCRRLEQYSKRGLKECSF